ncbi:hypothetical protein B484DRAFT_16575 [Ochromonadaceae sp. CCMP2298]|nr:hypothetical protein B484DRAFT_16575 [Ochromonadaceae sp. CCMP2298]
MRDSHPYVARAKSGGMIKFHNGLMALSRFPIKNHFLAPYDKVSSLERHLATKSSLVVEVEIPGLGTPPTTPTAPTTASASAAITLTTSTSASAGGGGTTTSTTPTPTTATFVNMHTTAGGEADPEHPDADTDREDELRQAFDLCQTADRAGSVGIIVGDLNCGPQASPGNFHYILNRGFRDTWAEAQAGGLSEGPEYTWDPANYLNAIGPHRGCPGQRCVQVGGVTSTLSDHHGLLITLSKKG